MRLIFALALLFSASMAGFAQAPAPAEKQGIGDVLTYIFKLDYLLFHFADPDVVRFKAEVRQVHFFRRRG